MTEKSAMETAVIRKISLIPFLMLCYFLSMPDRTNTGVAALQLNPAVGSSPAACGLAS
jgi:ACS family tartrate transporter-like MFS transporter